MRVQPLYFVLGGMGMTHKYHDREWLEPCANCQCHNNPSGYCIGCVHKWLVEAENIGYRKAESEHRVARLLEEANHDKKTRL